MKLGPIRCPETSIAIYQPTPNIVSEYRRASTYKDSVYVYFDYLSWQLAGVAEENNVGLVNIRPGI